MKGSPSRPVSSDFQRFPSSGLHIGTIVEWVDEKGYGWVEFEGKWFFVHIKAFEGGQRRPKAGETIRFIQGIDSKGRSCARKVSFARLGGRVGVGVWLLLSALLALPLLALLWLRFPWWHGAGAMGIVSAITYGMYAHDKGRAMTAGWRVPESSLHLEELLGGWPGALLAQRRLRHKCSKTRYQFVFWCIIILFQAAALDVILEHGLSRGLLAFMNQ